MKVKMIFMKLPIKCNVDKFIPKKTFYEKVQLSSAIKQEMIEKLDKIYWKYKISQENTNIVKTEEIEEIEVFEMILKERYNAQNIINIITKSIPYPILFKINYKNDYRYAIKYENDIIQTEWNENIDLSINGMDLKTVYENFVRQIANIDNNFTDVKQELAKIKQIEELEKEINKMKNNIQKEKQFNKKVELNKKLIELEKEMEALKDE